MSFLAPTVKTSQSVGKTDEFALTSSKYGEPIPLLFGTQRLPGNIIWAPERGIREEKTVDVQTQGGKGAPKQETTTTTFRYYIDMAVGICEGPVADTIQRIWADGKLIYDISGSSDITEIEGFTFRFYNGSETQVPDPLIEEDIGEDLTPAFRGMAYVVFEDFPLSNFGNRIPGLTFELGTGGATIGDAVQQSLGTSILFNLNNIGGFVRPVVSNNAYGDLFHGDGTQLRRIDPSDGTVKGTVTIQSEGFDNHVFVGVTADGRALTKERTSSLSNALGIHDASTGALLKDISVGGQVRQAVEIPSGVGTFVAAEIGADLSGNTPGFMIVDVDNSTDDGASPNNPVTDIADTDAEGEVTSNIVVGDVTEGEAFALQRKSNTSLELYKAKTSPFGVSLVRDFSPTDFVAGGTAFDSNISQHAVGYDAVRKRVLISADIDNTSYVMAYDSVQNEIAWVTEVPNNGPGFNALVFASGPNIRVMGAGNSILLWTQIPTQGSNSVKAWALNVIDGSFIPPYNGSQNIANLAIGGGGSGSESSIFWDSTQNALWHFTAETGGDNEPPTDGAYRYTFGISGLGNDVPLSNVIIGICQKAGLAVDDIDVSDVPATFPGLKSYVVDSRQTASSALQSYLNVLQIDAYESDFKLKFARRGQKSQSVSISEDDFIATSNTEGETYARPRINEDDLPQRFEVSYKDPANQYQDNVQSDTRSVDAVRSLNVENAEYRGSMEASLARQQAQTLMYSTWVERERVTTRLPWKYLALDPTDIIELTLDTGETFEGRLRAADIGASFETEIDLVVQTSDLFTANIEGTSGDNNVVKAPPFTGDSDVFLLDMPLLRDVDSPGQSATLTYWSGSGEDFWGGVVLYRENTETQVEQVGKQTSALPFGVVVTPPADATQFFRFDRDATMEVEITRDADQFASATELDILNGANVLAVKKANGEIEILQFTTVTVGATANDLTLTGLLRGRRGTDVFAKGIQADDQVFLLTAANLNTFVQDVGQVDAEKTYRGVTYGQLFEDADEFTYTDTGRDLKPYSPVKIEIASGTPDGVDISWTRRTRIGGENDLSTTAADVPLSEDSEEYEVDILDGPGGSVVRTFTGLTSESVNYSDSDITTDFGSLPATLNVVVYQISAAVGRGFPGEAALDTSGI